LNDRASQGFNIGAGTFLKIFKQKGGLTPQTLIDEIAAWEHDRNANHTKANWQFTTENARIRLKHLYPSI
jgi:hypothetical protein